MRIEKNVVSPPPINIWSQLNLFFELGFFQTPPPLFEQMSENMQFFFWRRPLFRWIVILICIVTSQLLANATYSVRIDWLLTYLYSQVVKRALMETHHIKQEFVGECKQNQGKQVSKFLLFQFYNCSAKLFPSKLLLKTLKGSFKLEHEKQTQYHLPIISTVITVISSNCRNYHALV